MLALLWSAVGAGIYAHRWYWYNSFQERRDEWEGMNAEMNPGFQ